MELILLENGKYYFGGEEYSKESLALLVKNEVFLNIAKKQGGIVKINTDNLINIDKKRRFGSIQKIFFGSPGTGKSYKINNIIRESYPYYNESLGNCEYVYRTAIHPNFDYNEFIGNIMPVVESDGGNKNITYDFKPGIFTKALFMALKTDNDVYLVLEEMTRGNIAEIFGDLFQLLDRNLQDQSSYAISNSLIFNFIEEMFIKEGKKCPLVKENIYLPANMHIIGTVNTSDQNVYVMDTAFKRRFEMEYMSLKPVKDDNGKFLNNSEFEIANTKINWIDLYQKINKFILNKLKMNEDKQLGQFFLKFKNYKDYNLDNLDKDTINSVKNYIKRWNKNQFEDKLMMYLWYDIHKSTIISEHTIFHNRFYCVEELLKALKNGEQIFSEEFNELGN